MEKREPWIEFEIGIEREPNLLKRRLEKPIIHARTSKIFSREPHSAKMEKTVFEIFVSE
jgi:hypothetical protein